MSAGARWPVASSTPIPPGRLPTLVQIVGYEAATGEAEGEGQNHATLLLASDGSVSRQSLAPGEYLEYALGDRHCAGRVTDDGHEPCGAPAAPYCDVHVSRWPCARCTGDCDLPIEACREEHAVYLAAFAPETFKVGVTRSWRLKTRLREQGADRAAHLRTVTDGRVARQIEADIAADVGDSVRVPAKIYGLGQSVDEAAWETLLADYEPVETYDFDYGLDLAERPMAETLATGTVVGTKGRVLVLQRTGSTYAVDLRDLVGHEIGEREGDRALQASLGAFD